jgi:hypothetical protein
MASNKNPMPQDSILSQPKENEPHEVVEIKTTVRVSREQAEAFKSLPKELQDRLGPPIYGQVLKPEELRNLARVAVHSAETSSTVMCPW